MCSRRSINININSIVIPTRVSRCIKIAYTIHNARQSLRWIKYRQRILQKRDRRILSNFFYKTLMLNSNIVSILCPFLRGRQRVLSKDEGTSRMERKHPRFHGSFRIPPPRNTMIYLRPVPYPRGTILSPFLSGTLADQEFLLQERKGFIYLVDTQLRFQASFERGKLIVSKWYRDGDHWISSVFFVERRIYVYIERKKFVTWKLYYLYFYRQFEVWWVFEILWYDEKDEILWQYSMKEDVL